MRTFAGQIEINKTVTCVERNCHSSHELFSSYFIYRMWSSVLLLSGFKCWSKWRGMSGPKEYIRLNLANEHVNILCWNRELTLKCKLKCYVKPMKDPLGVNPSKGNQGTTRGKEKFFSFTSCGNHQPRSKLFFFTSCGSWFLL